MIAPIGRRLLQTTLIALTVLASIASSQAIAMAPEGWVVLKSKHSYADLVKAGFAKAKVQLPKPN